MKLRLDRKSFNQILAPVRTDRVSGEGRLTTRQVFWQFFYDEVIHNFVCVCIGEL